MRLTVTARPGWRISLLVFFATLYLLAAFSGYARPKPTPQSTSATKTSGSGRVALYAAVGDVLTTYGVNVKTATLTKGSSVTLPGNVQEAYPHPSRKFIYVAWSNGGASYVAPGASPFPVATSSGITAFRVDSNSGALSPIGQPAKLPARPIYITTDLPGTHVLAASSQPSGLLVFRILPDGTLGAQVPPAARLDVGVYAHQVRVEPSNKTVILVTRGNGPTKIKPEDPGAIKILSYNDGVLANRASIAPGGGYNFQSRHLDFHPSKPWIFLTLERQNKLEMWSELGDGTLSPQPSFVKETLTDPSHIRPGQAVGTIHMHPSGKFVYLANRATDTEDFQGKSVFSGGENSIAAFAINQETGEPTLIQNIDTRGLSPRTFSLDPSGQILVVANQVPFWKRDGTGVKLIPASLAVFRIGADGKLNFVRQYDIPASGSKSIFWMGMVGLP